MRYNGRLVMNWGRKSEASEEVPDNLGCAMSEEQVNPKRASRRPGERGANGGNHNEETCSLAGGL
jgi:hypothetical protein